MLAIIIIENYYLFLICVWVERNLHVRSAKGRRIDFFEVAVQNWRLEDSSLNRMYFERLPTLATSQKS